MSAANPKARRAVLITGASSGIGRALAQRFAASGWDLILTGRDPSALAQVDTECRRAGTRNLAVVADLAAAGALGGLLAQAVAAEFEMAALVNNAGSGCYGRFENNGRERIDHDITVNIRALTELTHAVLPSMLERRRGRILNIASTAAFHPGPLMAVYAASKSYVLSFSEALSVELAGTGVTVTAFCPGPTRTRFQERAGMHAGSARMAPADEVAAHAYAAMMRGQAVVTHGWRNRLLHSLLATLPRQTQSRLVHAARARVAGAGGAA